MCRLAELLGGQRVFCQLAAVLAEAEDLHFVSALVQALNLILLTAPEVRQATQLSDCSYALARSGTAVTLHRP